MNPNPWAVRLVTATAWALAAGSAVFWALRVTTPAAATPVPAVARAAPVADPALLGRWLGAGAAAEPAALATPAVARHVLVGVVGGAGGAALIATDGKPARPVRVGAVVEEGLILKRTGARSAELAPSLDAPTAQTLELARRR